jgi:hypothetical protein
MRRLAGVVLVCVGVFVVVLGLAAASACAEQAWWRVTSQSRPTYLHAGAAKDEVQQLVVSGGSFVGSKGALFVLEVEQREIAVFATEEVASRFGFPEATAANIQAALEEEDAYGAGNVVVSEEAGAGGLRFVITSVGGKADQAVAPIEVIREESEETVEAKVVDEGASDGTVVASVLNVGDASTSEGVRIVDRLPGGLRAVSVEGVREKEKAGGHESLECLLERKQPGEAPFVVCMVPAGAVLPFDLVEVRVGVVVEGDAPANAVNESESNEISVSGGGAPAVTIRRPVRLSEMAAPFGIEDYELDLEEEGGKVDTQAGSHPFQTTFTINLNQVKQSRSGDGHITGGPVALARDVRDNLPPGLIGNPQALAHCTLVEFLALNNECPAASVVGVAVVTVSEPVNVGLATFTVPVFNLEPSAGEPAELGFLPDGRENPVYIDARVRTGSDYGVTGEAHNVPQTIAFIANSVTLWGVPGAASHDGTRDYSCLEISEKPEITPPCQPLEESSPQPFFEAPTSCPVNPATHLPEPLQSSVEADSWDEPGDFGQPARTSQPAAGIDGCDRISFEPSIKVKPSVQDASSSTGLTVDVHNPQQGSLNPAGFGEGDPKDITVALPEGLAINPAGAGGLEACSEGLVGYKGSAVPELQPGVESPSFSPRLPGSFPAKQAGEAAALEPGVNFCSNASKIATVKITTPLLKGPLEGAVYLAAQEANPFGSLVAMYIVAEEKESGVLVKIPGQVHLSSSGQIVTTIEDSPQAPFEDAELDFFEGERASLSTPASCGTYTTEASLTPWSAEPSDQAALTVEPSAKFNITSGPGGGACPGSSLPFAPSLTAGTTSNQAGAFSPFTTTVSREDGNQPLQAIALATPEGLSGLLAGVELCQEPYADEGLCGPNSQIGETTVSVGVGGHPYTVTGGKVYITGPFNGSGGCTVGTPGCAPFGLSIVNPAKAGPYDLENTKAHKPACDCVLVRAKIEVNPLTAALTVTSDNEGQYKIPTILEGIPVEIQHVNVTINRPAFTFNPTDCDPMLITGGLSSSEDASQSLTVPFQAANCAALKYEPKLTLTTNAHTSKADGASLDFKIEYPKGALGHDAWFSKAKFDIPNQLPARLTTLQKACPEAQFAANPAGCPPASTIGHAIVHTEELPVPLEGPVYFVSYGNAKFPEVVMVLQGYGVTIDLHGETFIHNGVTSATFRTIPDAPFESTEVDIPSGPHSEFAANGNLCDETKTVLVSKKEKITTNGHTKTITRKTKKTEHVTLQMPTAFVAQNGTEIHQDTPIHVTDCPKTKTTKTKKASKKHNNKQH